jgi:hypothetical protein
MLKNSCHRRHPPLAHARPLKSEPVVPVIPATRDRNGQPIEIEWGGVFFRKDEDQERALRARREDVVRDTIRTQAGSAVLRLANELVDLACLAAVDNEDDVLRRIGWMLVTNGRQDLWQLAYLEANRGSCYLVGDEVRFLLNEPRGRPFPLHEG